MNTRYRFPAAALAALTLLAAACARIAPPHAPLGNAKGFSAGDVIAWAHLDAALGGNPDALSVGAADGQCLVADRVMVWNGRDMVDFVKAHGYRSHRGPVAVRETPSQLLVDVEITGADGATLVITLKSDGHPQGRG